MTIESTFSSLSLEFSLSGLIFFDPEKMMILFLNPRALALLTKNENAIIVGKSIFVFLQSEVDRNILKKDEYYGEFSLVRDDGSEFPVVASIKSAIRDGVKYGVISFQDTSDQKKILRELTSKQEGLQEILQELLQKNEDLLKLDKAKDKFISLVTHELRTPLNTIVATSEIVYKKMFDTDEEYTELTKHLYLQSTHMLDLVNDILDITKIHSGKMELYVEQADPSEILEDQASFFSEMAANEGVKIVFDKSPRQLLCYFDKMRLKQITSNLISNAIKFNKADGRVILKLIEKEDFVQISVTDNGIGIPESKFDSIFNEFETIENLANHHKGTGLGLPIVKSLVQGLGGSISLTSVMGEGSTFFISLPKAKVLEETCYRSRQADGVFFFDDQS